MLLYMALLLITRVFTHARMYASSSCAPEVFPTSLTLINAMAETSCYEPSSLIASIHKGVPFLTDADHDDQSAELVLHLSDGTSAFYDNFVVNIAVASLPTTLYIYVQG